MRTNASRNENKSKSRCKRSNKTYSKVKPGKSSKIGFGRSGENMAVGKSTAEAYQLQVSAMGGDNLPDISNRRNW